MNLLPATLITIPPAAPLIGPILQFQLPKPLAVLLVAQFNYAGGGTSLNAFIQSSADGTFWFDSACFSFATSSGILLLNLSALTPLSAAVAPTDMALAANTSKDFIGNFARVKLAQVGNYTSGTSLVIDAAPVF
jgi:hypothetical protein